LPLLIRSFLCFEPFAQIVHHPSYTQTKNLWDCRQLYSRKGVLFCGQSRVVSTSARCQSYPSFHFHSNVHRYSVHCCIVHREVISVRLLCADLSASGGGRLTLLCLCLPLRGFFSSTARAISAMLLRASSWHLDRYSMVFLSQLYCFLTLLTLCCKVESSS
jgi:hypothetical protein